MYDPTNKWGGFMFKCVQCGYHTIINDGMTPREAYRHLPHGAAECEPDDEIMRQFREAGIKPFQI